MLAFAKIATAQPDSLLNYRGSWEGELSIKADQIVVPVSLEFLPTGDYQFRVGNVKKLVKMDGGSSLELELAEGVTCNAAVKGE